MKPVIEFIKNDELANLVFSSDNKISFTIAYAEISNYSKPSFQEIVDFTENLKSILNEFQFEYQIETDASDNKNLFVTVSKK